MAGRGPAPKDPVTRVRRNKPPTSRAIAGDGKLHGPALPAGALTDKEGKPEPWHAQTVKWWEHWRKTPQSVEFVETDWDYLLDTALMHHQMWAKGRWDFASEVRLRVAKFGATPDDRKRMNIDVSPASKPAPPTRPQGVTDISSRRKRLAG